LTSNSVQTVGTMREFLTAVKNVPPGQALKLELIRNGRTETVEIPAALAVDQ